jgi:hypothetical protein
VTTDSFLRSVYAAGVTPAEAKRLPIRELLLVQQAQERRARRQELQLIGLRNDVRSALGGDPIDPYGRADTDGQDTDLGDAARHALLRQTDFSDSESPSSDRSTE